MTSAVRFSGAYARMRALKSTLWTASDRALLLRRGIEPDGTPLTADLDRAFAGLVRWYSTFIRVYPSGAPLLRALVRLHEIENLKLQLRAAVRGRPVPIQCWRPLGRLAQLPFVERAGSIADVVQRLRRTPYAPLAPSLLRADPADLAATEIGIDRWAWIAVDAEAARLGTNERTTHDLARLLILEHDVDLLRRAASFGLDADLVAKSTVVLSREHTVADLVACMSDARAPALLARLMRREGAEPDHANVTWDDVVTKLRRVRLAACRRAFLGWPYRLAPAVAAILLREEQTRAELSLVSAQTAGASGADALAQALAASPLEG